LEKGEEWREITQNRWVETEFQKPNKAEGCNSPEKTAGVKKGYTQKDKTPGWKVTNEENGQDSFEWTGEEKKGSLREGCHST